MGGSLDDDDLWHPDRLRLAADHISTHSGCMAWQAASWRFRRLDNLPGSISRHLILTSALRRREGHGVDLGHDVFYITNGVMTFLGARGT